MNVLHFESRDEMLTYLAQAQAQAQRSMHHAQARITWGDHWVRFIDVAQAEVEFGRVFLPDEVADLEVAAGATAQEATTAVEDVTTGLANGYLYGVAHSSHFPDGEAGETHKASVWPIERDLFDAAQSVAWRIRLLPLAQKINLELAFRQWRLHRRSLRARGMA